MLSTASAVGALPSFVAAATAAWYCSAVTFSKPVVGVDAMGSLAPVDVCTKPVTIPLPSSACTAVVPRSAFHALPLATLLATLPAVSSNTSVDISPTSAFFNDSFTTAAWASFASLLSAPGMNLLATADTMPPTAPVARALLSAVSGLSPSFIAWSYVSWATLAPWVTALAPRAAASATVMPAPNALATVIAPLPTSKLTPFATINSAS